MEKAMKKKKKLSAAHETVRTDELAHYATIEEIREGLWGFMPAIMKRWPTAGSQQKKEGLRGSGE